MTTKQAPMPPAEDHYHHPARAPYQTVGAYPPAPLPQSRCPTVDASSPNTVERGERLPPAYYSPNEADRAETHSNKKKPTCDWDKLARLVCAVLLPPLGVFLQTGCNKDLAINALLTLLGYLPGIIHATFVILTAK